MSEQTFKFIVPGIPKPGGSKRAFMNPRTKRIIVTEDCKTSKDWRGDVKAFAVREWQAPPLEGPIQLEVVFVMPRPKGHYRTGKNALILRKNAPEHPTTKPDATKLLRSTEDALTGILWKDDAQIWCQNVTKTYGECPGAQIQVWFEEQR